MEREVTQRLRGVLAELIAREPIFHHRELVHDRGSFERETAPDFWEMGAPRKPARRREAGRARYSNVVSSSSAPTRLGTHRRQASMASSRASSSGSAASRTWIQL